MKRLSTASAFLYHLATISLVLLQTDNVVFAKKSTASYFNRPTDRPLILAHRGSSGLYPEHSEAAYKAAFFSGADFIETDLVLSKDGVLFASHDLTLSSS